MEKRYGRLILNSKIINKAIFLKNFNVQKDNHETDNYVTKYHFAMHIQQVKVQSEGNF